MAATARGRLTAIFSPLLSSPNTLPRICSGVCSWIAVCIGIATSALCKPKNKHTTNPSQSLFTRAKHRKETAIPTKPIKGKGRWLNRCPNCPKIKAPIAKPMPVAATKKPKSSRLLVSNSAKLRDNFCIAPKTEYSKMSCTIAPPIR